MLINTYKGIFINNTIIGYMPIVLILTSGVYGDYFTKSRFASLISGH